MATRAEQRKGQRGFDSRTLHMPWYKIEFTAPIPDTEWVYEEKELDKKGRKALFDDYAERYSGSEHIKGTVGGFDHPPVEECRAMVQAAKKRIAWEQRHIQRLERWTTKAQEAAERLSGPPPELDSTALESE